MQAKLEEVKKESAGLWANLDQANKEADDAKKNLTQQTEAK